MSSFLSLDLDGDILSLEFVGEGNTSFLDDSFLKRFVPADREILVLVRKLRIGFALFLRFPKTHPFGFSMPRKLLYVLLFVFWTRIFIGVHGLLHEWQIWLDVLVCGCRCFNLRLAHFIEEIGLHVFIWCFVDYALRRTNERCGNICRTWDNLL